MASKSKKRRRVLGASCILAALIIAGSSFAWFTSKDEVTNRLTANSDYGVSIVESFVPPANWIPGQEINKDVYAVNTGNIAAFVKENVSSKLTYTYEDLVDHFDTTCVELGENVAKVVDGATTEEAGGFLAWTNAQVDDGNGGTMTYPTGSVNSARIEDATADDTGVTPDRWIPPATGDYIFRRAIKTTTDDSTNPPTVTSTFTYAGYHYEAPAANTPDDPDTPIDENKEGKYYKIVLGSDNYPTVDNNTHKQEYDIYADQTALGVAVNADGSLQSAPKISYVVENKVENVTPTLVFHTGASNENDYLQVLYSENNGTQAQLDDNQKTLDEAKAALEAAKLADSAASTDLAQKEVGLRNAEGAYNSAKSRYDQTKADYEYAKALTDATNELVASAKKKADADAALNKALDQFNKAAQDLRDEAGNEQTTLSNLWAAWTDDGTADIDPNTANGIIPANVRRYITENGVANNNYNAGNSDLTNAKNNLDAMDALWGQSSDTAASETITGYVIKLDEAYLTLATLNSSANVAASSEAATPANVKAQYDIIEETMTKLMNALNNYKTLYAGFVDAVTSGNVPENLLTGLNTEAATTRLDGIVNAVKGILEDTAEHNVKTVLKGLVDDYETKYNALVAAENTAAAEAANWTTAIERYNNKVGAAKTTYEGTSGIGANQTLPNDYAFLQGTGNTNRILKDYGKENDAAKNYVQGAFTATLAADAYSTDYSAVSDTTKSLSGTDVGDPKIKTDAPYTDYVSVAATPDTNGDYAVTKLLVRKVKAEDDFTQIEANYADNEIGSAAQKLSELKTKMNTAAGNVTTAQGNFDTAGNTKTQTAAAIAPAQAAVNAAQAALNNAANAATINIKVYLDENWDDNWTMDPADAAGSTDVDFYLNKILEAGETSARLIDAVKLDDSMSSRDYKDLTFDLNVGLDSIQVTYDANQRDYTADAVNAANETFKMDVTNAAPLTSDTVLTWQVATDAVGTTYSADVVGVPVTITKVTPVTVGTESYEYKIEDGSDVYYGKSTAAGTVFTKVEDPAASTLTFADPAVTKTLDNDATKNA